MTDASTRRMTSMDDLVTWLRQQIAEDERVAHAAETRLNAWAPDLPPWESARYLGKFGSSFDNFVARHNPAAVLAQCEAHRRIVDDFAALLANRDRHTDPALHLQYNVLHGVVRALALAYQHRDGYRPEWRP